MSDSCMQVTDTILQCSLETYAKLHCLKYPITLHHPMHLDHV